MAKKWKFLSYGTGKRKIGHSKFDMGFSNTYSQGFGELNPVAVYETLPDDYWNIGSDGVTLLKPLSAPAFSDIKQHFYAFNVRNSAIWKHWNSFITNGTAFSDVYGSNTTNQAADNPWKVPSINAGYLQDICKIGSGFGFEQHVLTISATNLSDTPLSELVSAPTYSQLSATPYDITSLLSLILSKFYEYYEGNDSRLFSKRLFTIIRDCLVACFVRGTGVTPTEFSFVFACSRTLYSEIVNLFGNPTLVTPATRTPDPLDDDTKERGLLEAPSASYLSFRLMCDDSAAMCKPSLSPFILSQGSYMTNNNVFKTYYWKRRYSIQETTIIKKTFTVGSGTVDHYLFRSCDTNFFGRDFVLHDGGSGSFSFWSSNVFDPNAQPNDPHWILPFSFFSLSPSNANSAITSAQIRFAYMFPYLGVVRPFTECFALPYGQYFANDYDIYYQSSNTLNIPVVTTGPQFSASYEYNAAKSLGYDISGFCVYLAKNSYRLIESMNLPAVALACRSYVYYRYQDFNALPFFAYSKIFGDYFRNKVVTSPELDFSETNGHLLFGKQMRDYLADLTNFSTPDTRPELYNVTETDIRNMEFNSWVIPFQAVPLNGMINEYLATNSTPSYAIFLNGHHNDLVISSRTDVFSLLTGFELDNLVLRKLYSVFQTQTAASGYSYNTFTELFTKNFYLPSYYNGLLHLRFQNFNKDYFTAAMLDPMSGANQVAIGSTVTENRVAEAKQSWFEKIAPKRSVEGFMETIFGITPTLDNDNSNFLGSTHVPVHIGEVIQTSSSVPESPQGQRAGIGGSRGGSSLVHGHVNEHGWLIILNSFTVESQYQQGLERQWNVINSYMDYPTVDFAHVGNDSVLMKELNFDGQPILPYVALPYDVNSEEYVSPTFFDHKGGVIYGTGNPTKVFVSPGFSSALKVGGLHPNALQTTIGYCFSGARNFAYGSGSGLDNVFGYLPRYSSYKFKMDQVHGEFLDEFSFWHTFRHFYGMPVLSHEFVNWELCVDDNEFNRIFAVTTNDDNKFMCETYFNASVDRALPYVCVPSSK